MCVCVCVWRLHGHSSVGCMYKAAYTLPCMINPVNRAYIHILYMRIESMPEGIYSADTHARQEEVDTHKRDVGPAHNDWRLTSRFVECDGMGEHYERRPIECTVYSHHHAENYSRSLNCCSLYRSISHLPYTAAVYIGQSATVHTLLQSI